MKELKLNKKALYGIYAGLCVILLGALYYIDFSNKNLQNTKPEEDDYQYVNRLFEDETVPVVNTESTIIRPYTNTNVKVVQSFYNYKGNEEEQQNSIINYEQTYIQNTGVAYGGIEEGFEAISVLPGTVTSVKEDNLLGTIIEIKNSNKVTTIYQGLTEVSLKENDKVNQGDILGKSGESNINKDLGKHIVFQLKLNGAYVNPEDYYEKNINEL